MGLLSTLFSDKPSCCLKLETPIYRKFPTVIGGSSNANRCYWLLECRWNVSLGWNGWKGR
jgi:hypothetical protein